MVKKVNTEEFKSEALQGTSVVDFSALWCGPCKMMGPVLEEVSDEMTDVKFYNVDVDEERELAMEYGISSIPAIVVIKDGVKQGMLVGFKPKNVIEKELGDLI